MFLEIREILRDFNEVFTAEKVSKNIEYKANILECGNIRVFLYVLTPPSLFKRGDS